MKNIDTKKRKLLAGALLASLGVNPISAKNEKSGMFYHLHYFKFKPEVSEIEIAKLMKELVALQDKIPVLKSSGLGRMIPNGKGFQYGK